MKDLKSYIDELHNKIDIVSIISRYVKLKKRGRNFIGLCPFHDDKNPSFVVSPEKQIFHCFGCGASGDVIKFLMRIEGIDFKEAVRILAKEAKIAPPAFTYGGIDKTEKENLYKVMETATVLFQQNIIRDVLIYLEKRGVTKESIEKFRFGYASPNGDKFIKEMKEEGISEDLLIKVGILRKMENGRKRIYFRNRVMLPIFDSQGRVVAFGGRIFGKGEPKYLNSPDTPIFTKGNLLYPINIAKEGIRKEKAAIVVEGYFDALVLQQSGIGNAVSSMGTSFTEAQAGLIKRYADTVYFFYDGDEAGRKGAERAVEICSKKGLTAKIVVGKEGLDPDEIVLQQGKEGIVKLLNEAKDPIDFITLFELKKEGNTPSGKARVAKKVLETIDKIYNRIEAYEYVKRVGGILGITPEILFKQYTPVPTYHKKKKMEKLDVNDIMSNTERLLTQAVIQRPETLYKILEKIDINNFPDESYIKIFNRAKEDIENGKVPDVKSWLDLTDEEFSLATELSMTDVHLVGDKAIDQVIKRVNNYIMQVRAAELYNEIREIKDEEKLKEKLMQYQEIMKEIKRR